MNNMEITPTPGTTDILLVEDNPDHAELTIHALKGGRLQNRIVHVLDGQEALDYLYHKGSYSDAETAPTPGLILLDLRLPKVDGLEVLERIKKDLRLRSIPVCMLTTSADNGDIERCFTAGANSYVSKPVQFSEFIDKVRQLSQFWFTVSLRPTPGVGA